MISKVPPVVHPSSHARSDLEALARECASLDAGACEAAIAEHAMLAIRERRIDDAVFWQRVKFRSRMLRAMARGRIDDVGEGQGHGRSDRT